MAYTVQQAKRKLKQTAEEAGFTSGTIWYEKDDAGQLRAKVYDLSGQLRWMGSVELATA